MDQKIIPPQHLNPADWIAIANIIVTALIGLWVVIFVQKKYAINRAVKDYFIAECQEIKTFYAKFLNDLYSQKLTSNNIINWFKVMTIRIEIFESLLCYEFRISPELNNYHSTIKQFVTGTDEFNDQFNKKSVYLSPTTLNEILRHHQEFTIRLSKTVININKAQNRLHNGTIAKRKVAQLFNRVCQKIGLKKMD